MRIAPKPPRTSFLGAEVGGWLRRGNTTEGKEKVDKDVFKKILQVASKPEDKLQGQKKKKKKSDSSKAQQATTQSVLASKS